MTLEERKAAIIERAVQKLEPTLLESFTTEVNAANNIEALKIVIAGYKNPEAILQWDKDRIETYLWYLRNRGIIWQDLEKRKQAMLNATTSVEFVAAYKWE